MKIREDKFNFVSHEVNQTRGNKFKIFQEHVHYNLRKYYFSNRVIQIWNSLPDSVVESNSINSFKNNLYKFWQNEDVKFNWKANLTGAGSNSLRVSGLFVPWTIRTMDYSYVGLFVRWTFRTTDYSYYGLFVYTYADKFFWAALWTWVLR